MYDEALKEQKQGVTRYRQPNRKPTVRARNTLLLTWQGNDHVVKNH
jgi:hypothetical protein